MAGLLALPVPFALMGSESAVRWLFLLAGSATVLVLANLAARFLKSRLSFGLFVIAPGLMGLVVITAFPTFVFEDGEVRTRNWPELFRGLAFGLGPLAAYDRVPWLRKRPGRRRHNPPKG